MPVRQRRGSSASCQNLSKKETEHNLCMLYCSVSIPYISTVVKSISKILCSNFHRFVLRGGRVCDWFVNDVKQRPFSKPWNK